MKTILLLITLISFSSSQTNHLMYWGNGNFTSACGSTATLEVKFHSILYSEGRFKLSGEVFDFHTGEVFKGISIATGFLKDTIDTTSTVHIPLKIQVINEFKVDSTGNFNVEMYIPKKVYFLASSYYIKEFSREYLLNLSR